MNLRATATTSTAGVPSAVEAPSPGPTEPPRSRGAFLRRLRPYAFLTPGFLLFALVMLWPMVMAFRMSLYDWNVLPGATSEFVGAANYLRALDDPIFWTALVNTGVYMILTVPTQMALGMGAAVLLSSKAPGRITFRVLYYLPVVSSWVVVSLLFKYLFNSQAGLVNYALVDVLGVLDANVSWLQDRWTALAAISILGIWKGMGWSMLIFLAALQGVPQDLLEAATVDGASRWQRFRHVTVPQLRPVIAFVTVMLVIGGFNVFISVFLITGGGPAHQTEVLLTHMYTQAFEFLDFGYGSALAYILTAIVFVFSVVQMRFFRYGEDD